MPTIAEQLAALYWTLYERREAALDGALDALFDAIADLDTLAGGITHEGVRALLDGRGG